MARTKLVHLLPSGSWNESGNEVVDHRACLRCSVMNLDFQLEEPSSAHFIFDSAVDAHFRNTVIGILREDSPKIECEDSTQLEGGNK